MIVLDMLVGVTTALMGVLCCLKWLRIRAQSGRADG